MAEAKSTLIGTGCHRTASDLNNVIRAGPIRLSGQQDSSITQPEPSVQFSILLSQVPEHARRDLSPLSSSATGRSLHRLPIRQHQPSLPMGETRSADQDKESRNTCIRSVNGHLSSSLALPRDSLHLQTTQAEPRDQYASVRNTTTPLRAGSPGSESDWQPSNGDIVPESTEDMDDGQNEGHTTKSSESQLPDGMNNDRPGTDEGHTQQPRRTTTRSLRSALSRSKYENNLDEDYSKPDGAGQPGTESNEDADEDVTDGGDSNSESGIEPEDRCHPTTAQPSTPLQVTNWCRDSLGPYCKCGSCVSCTLMKVQRC